MVPSFLARERTVAGPGYSRWLIPPAALAVHLCIGQVYATSVYKTALVAALRHQPHRDRDDLLDRDRDARALRGRLRHLGRHPRPARRDVRRRVLLEPSASWSARSASRPASCGWSTSATACIGGIGLGHRLHLPGVHADQVVPGPPGPGHRHGDHGLRRRRAHRQPAERPADGALRHVVRRHRPHVGARAATRSTMLFVTLGIVYFWLHDVRRLHGAGARRRLEAPRAGTPRRWPRSRWSRPRASRPRTRSGRRSSGCCGRCSSATSPPASASSSRPPR